MIVTDPKVLSILADIQRAEDRTIESVQKLVTALENQKAADLQRLRLALNLPTLDGLQIHHYPVEGVALIIRKDPRECKVYEHSAKRSESDWPGTPERSEGKSGTDG